VFSCSRRNFSSHHPPWLSSIKQTFSRSIELTGVSGIGYNGRDMKKRTNPTSRGIDDWKSARVMPKYETFFSRPINKGVRLHGPGIREDMSLRSLSDYYGDAGIVSSGWKPSIPFGQDLTVRCYTEAVK